MEDMLSHAVTLLRRVGGFRPLGPRAQGPQSGPFRPLVSIFRPRGANLGPGPSFKDGGPGPFFSQRIFFGNKDPDPHHADF